jgi:hypothetical protein
VFCRAPYTDRTQPVVCIKQSLLCLFFKFLLETAIFLKQFVILAFDDDELGGGVLEGLLELLDFIVVGLEERVEEGQVLEQGGLILEGVVEAALLAGQMCVEVVLNLEVAVQFVELAAHAHVWITQLLLMSLRTSMSVRRSLFSCRSIW